MSRVQSMYLRTILSLLCILVMARGVPGQDNSHWVATWGTAQLHAVVTLPPWVQR